MPENNFELQAVKNANNPAADTTSAALHREVELLRDGIGQGVMHRLSSPGDLLTGAGVAFAGGAALRMALDAGGKWGTAAKVLSSGFLVLAAADVTRRAIPTGEAMYDTWKSGKNLEANKVTVANNLGTALLDYPLMTVAGGAGFRMAGRPISMQIDLTNPAFKPGALRDMSFPKDSPYYIEPIGKIGPETPVKKPWNSHIDRVEASGLKLSEIGLKASELAVKPVDAGMKAPESGVKSSELFKGYPSQSVIDPRFSFKNLPDIHLPNKIDLSAINRSLSSMNLVEIRSSRIFPAFPVLPVDAMDKLELVHRANNDVQLLQDQNGAKNKDAVLEDKAQQNRLKIEELPKLKMLELPALKIEALPQAQFHLEQVRQVNPQESYGDLVKSIKRIDNAPLKTIVKDIDQILTDVSHGKLGTKLESTIRTAYDAAEAKRPGNGGACEISELVNPLNTLLKANKSEFKIHCISVNAGYFDKNDGGSHLLGVAKNDQEFESISNEYIKQKGPTPNTANKLFEIKCK